MLVNMYNLYPESDDEAMEVKLESLRELKSSPSCVGYRNSLNGNYRIIVAGGTTEVGTLTNSVEVFHYEKRQWFMLENMPSLHSGGTFVRKSLHLAQNQLGFLD